MELSRLNFSSNGIEELYRASPFARIIPGEDVRSNKQSSQFVTPPTPSIFNVPVANARYPRLVRPKRPVALASVSVPTKGHVRSWSRRGSGVISEEEEGARNRVSPGRSDCSYFFSEKEVNTYSTLENFDNSASPAQPKPPSPRKNLTPDFLASKRRHSHGRGAKQQSGSPVRSSLDFSHGNSVQHNQFDSEVSIMSDCTSVSNISERRVSKLDIIRSLQAESGYCSKSFDRSAAVSKDSAEGESNFEAPDQMTSASSEEADSAEIPLIDEAHQNNTEPVSRRLRRRRTANSGTNLESKSECNREESNKTEVKLKDAAGEPPEISVVLDNDEFVRPRSNRTCHKMANEKETEARETDTDCKESEKEGNERVIKRRVSRRGSKKSELRKIPSAVSEKAASNRKRSKENEKVVPIPETPKIPTTNKKEMRLKDWFIRPVTHVKGIMVEGDRADIPEGGMWHTTCIVHCLAPRSIQTASGSVYKLVGNISITDTVAQGFTKKFATAFKTGFPHNWMELVASHFKKPKKGKPKRQNTSTANNIFETPVNKILDISTCKRTSSGRTIIPASSIEWWKCVRVRINKETAAVEIRSKDGVGDSLTNKKKSRVEKVKKSQEVDSPDFVCPVRSPQFHAKKMSRVSFQKKEAKFSGRFDEKKANKGLKNSEVSAKTTRASKQQTRKQTKSTKQPKNMRNRASSRERCSNGKVATSCAVVITPFPVAKKKWDDAVSNSKEEKEVECQLSQGQHDNDVQIVKRSSRRRKCANQSTKPTQNGSRDDDKESESSDNDDPCSPCGRKTRQSSRVKSRRGSTVRDGKSTGGTKKCSTHARRNSSDDESWSPSGGKTRQSSRAKSRQGSTVKDGKSDGTKTCSTDARRKSSSGEAGWTLNEIEKLRVAMRQIPLSSPSFWLKVSSLVGTKTEEECQEFHYKDAPESSAKKKPNPSKPAVDSAKQQSIQLDGRNGTLKRKRQMRNVMEKFNEDYDSDFFDSTPFKKQKITKVTDLKKVDLEGFDCPDTPFPLQTPLPVGSGQMCVMPVSDKKTPHTNLSTPSFLRSHNQRDNDLYNHRMLKGKKPGRKLLHSKRKSLTVTPATAAVNVGPVITENQKSKIFHVTDVEDDCNDPDDDSDYYWSDEEDHE